MDARKCHFVVSRLKEEWVTSWIPKVYCYSKVHVLWRFDDYRLPVFFDASEVGL